MIQPSEVESFYILPALRSELCKALAGMKVSQREIAQKLGVTEAAVSQYLNSKRAHQVKLSTKARAQVEAMGKSITQGKIDAFHGLNELVGMIKDSGEMCDIHHQFDKACPSKCNECFEPQFVEVRLK